MRDTRSIPGRSTSPTARALKALELISARPGITADELGDALGVTGRAARRYVAILREAELNPGERLTGLGGRIVAEVFHRAMEGSRYSIVRDPFWRPFLSPVEDRRKAGTFEMTDLLLYAFEQNAELLNPVGV